MNKQDWQDYKSYLKSLKVNVNMKPGNISKESFVGIVNNKNIDRELHKIK